MVTAISRYGVRVIPNTMQVITALQKTGQLIDGPHVDALEETFAQRFGHSRAIATSSRNSPDVSPRRRESR